MPEPAQKTLDTPGMESSVPEAIQGFAEEVVETRDEAERLNTRYEDMRADLHRRMEKAKVPVVKVDDVSFMLEHPDTKLTMVGYRKPKDDGGED